MLKTMVPALALAVGLLAGCCANGACCETMATGLMTDQLVSARNIGAAPSFSWRMRSPRRGSAQTSYRITVNEGMPNGRCVWDSGETVCGKSVGVKYAGLPLKSAARYFWTVSVRDETGAWLEPATTSFTTGLFGKDDWNGSVWISAADAKVRTAPPPKHDHDLTTKQEAEDGTACFVKIVHNEKEVAEAYWTVAGLGVFDAYVNGESVGDFLKPGFTHNERTKYSFTYDVTRLMKTGRNDVNAFSAQVSSGWWRDKIVNFYGKKSAFRAQLILRYSDGTEKRVGTDATWPSATTGPVIRAGIFDGEDYDARVRNDWMQGKACDNFRPSEVNTEYRGELFPMVGATVQLRQDLALAPAEMYVWKGAEGAKDGEFGKVKKLRSYKDGDDIVVDKGETLVVDFAQNAAAVPSFAFSAAEGVTLTMRTAEMLNDGNGAKKRGCDGPEGSAYFTNYRAARSTVNYTFAGDGEESYHPNFTYFGYRYASITSTGRVTIKRIRSIPVTSIPDWADAGCIETGVKDVNQLISNVRWGQYSNYLSVPTDCPQRNERLGWTADTQVFTEAATYNANVYGFFVKWMRDMRDTQYRDGSYTGVAPVAQYGGDIHRLGWADAGVIVPYTIWRQYGDTRIIDECWESMKRYLALLEDMKFASPQARSQQWADWLSYEKLGHVSGDAYVIGPDGKRRPKPDALRYWQYLGCCYWLWDARMMSAMADATSRTGEADEYRAMAGRALKFLRENFVDTNDGMLLPAVLREMQTPALFALRLGILEKPEAIAKTSAVLLQNFRDHGDCLQTGFLGTSILMDALTYGAKAPEMAYTLLLQHKNPSWLYSVDQGATTVWERWDSYTRKDGFGAADMNSFNHYAYGSVLAWMYGTVAGIQEDEKSPGFKHIVLAPIPDKRIGSVKARFRSPYGLIESAWRYGDDGRWTWTFTIPANTTATVIVPGEEPKEYVAGTYTVVDRCADPASLVMPEMGTVNDVEFSSGNVYPMVSMPWGFSCFAPQTREPSSGRSAKARWFYDYRDRRLFGIRQTRQPSPWIGDYGAWSFLPYAGAAATNADSRASRFSHKAEKMTPSLYRVYLADWDVTVSLSPSLHAAKAEIVYPETKNSGLVVNHFDGGCARLEPDGRALSGWSVQNSTWGKLSAPVTNFFRLAFDRHAVRAEVLPGGATAVCFGPVERGTRLAVDIASSLISPEQALENSREVAGRSFRDVLAAADAEWNKALGTIKVESDDLGKLRTFYTCYWRTMLFPLALWEMTPDGRVMHWSPGVGKPMSGYYYAGTGFWDTFRALYPLMALVHPEMYARNLEGLENCWRECGWLPEWSGPGLVDCMIGQNSASVVAAGYLAGVRGGFDIQELWRALVRGANGRHPAQRSTGREGWRFYNEKGFVPRDVGISESAARTLEYAHDDACMAALGAAIGRPAEEIAVYRTRSENWRNVFDPKRRIVVGRNEDGTFNRDFDPFSWGGDFTEGCAHHYTWSVLHDIPGLVAAMGGEDAFEHRLDEMFTMPAEAEWSYYGKVIHEIREMQTMNFGQYAHGNQPVQHMIYLYDWCGAWDKAQRRVREVVDRLYRPVPDGYCGDEDNGQTSAWYVWSAALGMYPVYPASCEYALGAPAFDRVVVSLPSGAKLEIASEGASVGRVFSQAVFNGRVLSRPFVKLPDLQSGGRLEMRWP